MIWIKRNQLLYSLYNKPFKQPPRHKVTFSPFDYCMNSVKRSDYENYLCTLLLPSLIRPFAMTIRAFNIELAQIDSSTTQQFAAMMRIQFWREHIDKTFSGCPPNHPVTISLAMCLEKQMLSKSLFHRLIDVREKHVNNKPFMSVEDAESYGEFAVTPVYLLILEAMRSQSNPSELAALHLGRATSVLTLIRSAQHFLKQRKVLIPTELCFKYKLSQEDIIRNTHPQMTQELCIDISELAVFHLDQLKSVELSKAEKTVFLPRIANQLFIERLNKYGYDMYHQNLNERQWTLPWKLFKSSWFNN